MPRSDPVNHSRYWHDKAAPGLSLLHADFTNHDYAPHSHDALVVAATETGGAEFTSRGATGEARAEVLLAFNPAEPHWGRMARSRRWRYRAFYLTETVLGELAAALDVAATPYFTENDLADAHLAALFLDLHRALDADADTLRRRELLVASFGQLFRRHGSGGRRIPAAPRDRTLFDAAVALMRERHAEPLTLDALGTAVGLTPFQLIGLFKRAAGMTPHAYLTQIRLRAAIRDLRARRPLAEAALAAGFYDQSAFNRHFKRAYGITPRQYVRAVTG